MGSISLNEILERVLTNPPLPGELPHAYNKRMDALTMSTDEHPDVNVAVAHTIGGLQQQVIATKAQADREMQSWQYEREAYQRRCATAEARAEAAEAKVANYENRISWDTTCGNCARLLRKLLSRCPGGRKMLIETLCIAQSRVGNSPLDKHRQLRDIARLQWLINVLGG